LNRKIPLNGFLNVYVGEMKWSKGILDTVFMRIKDKMKHKLQFSSKNGDDIAIDAFDQTQTLTKMYKDGLNLCAVTSIFEESPDLKNDFGVHMSQIMSKSICPMFEDDFEYRIRMNEPIFDHFKYRCAQFEIRHYFDEEQVHMMAFSEKGSEVSSDSQQEGRDYLTLAVAKVPLVNIITKSNGVDTDVSLLDQFSQKVGELELKLSINYQSRRRTKISKEQAIKQIHGDYFLGFSFVELVSQKNSYLEIHEDQEELKHLLFRFEWEGNMHQVRYVPDNNIIDFPLSIKVFHIHKFYIFEFYIDDRTLKDAEKPLEIQIFSQIENKLNTKISKEEYIGSIYVSLNDLLENRIENNIKPEERDEINIHDGYYSVFNTKEKSATADRLGLKTMLFKKEYEDHKTDLEKVFYMLHNQAQKAILDEYDLTLGG
jgi:hypothetical protein